MSFPRYPKYKDSGVEWLGEVPEHWEVKRLRYLSIVRKGRLPSGTSPMPSADTDMPYLSMEYLRGETDTPSFVPVSQNLLRAESGDLLLLWDGSNAGEFLRAKQGVVSSTVALIEPRNVDREFLFFACKARERQLKDQTVGMGIPHVSGDELRDFLIPCPPLPEQTAIAEFLDRETGKIDELVAEQRRLMELLKEKRQAVISHAVTRGQNPTAPLKPSGIEWLGDVPEHWEVLPAKRISTVFVPQRNKPELNSDGEGVCWMTMEQMRNEEVTTTDLWVSEAAARDAGTRILKPGAVIASCVGTFGLAVINNAEVIINQQLQAFIPNRRIHAKFLRHCVVNAASYFEQIGTAATITYVNQFGFENMPLVLPPLDEQSEMVAFLAT